MNNLLIKDVENKMTKVERKVKRTRRKIERGFRTPLTIIVCILLGFFLAMYFFYRCFMFLGGWFDEHKVSRQDFIKFELRMPFKIEERSNDKKKEEKPKGEPSAIKSDTRSKIKDPAREAIYIYFGDNPVAYAVARAEAGLTCHKVGYNTNGTVDRGLFQINSIHDWRFAKFDGDPFDCWDNARVAHQIYSEQSWNPWSVFNNGRYLAFMP